MPERTAPFGFTAPTKMGQSKSVKHKDKNWGKGLGVKPGGELTSRTTRECYSSWRLIGYLCLLQYSYNEFLWYASAFRAKDAVSIEIEYFPDKV